MHSLSGIMHNHVLFAGLISWFFAQTLKIPFHYLVEKEWDIRRFRGSGGMPSSHTSFVVTTTIMVGALYGFDSGLFAISTVFSFVVMYDATGVRRETGRQATIINRILQEVIVEGKRISDDQLKELVGHKPVEVAGGVLLGFVVAGVYIMLLMNH